MPNLRRVVPATCALLLTLAPIGLASSTSPVNEYPLTTQTQGPTGIVAGPDGNLWFAETATNVLGSITPQGTFSPGFSGLSGPAQDVTVGPDHNLWVTEPGANKIGVVSPSGSLISEYATGGTKPWDITTGPDGNLWFTEQGGAGGIGEVTPAGVVTNYTAGLTNGSKPAGITAGPNGNVWFTESGGGGGIGQITPSGQITEYRGNLTAGGPLSIVNGPDGNLWFTESGNPGAIGRITPTGTVTEFTQGLTGSNVPSGLTVGPDGNLYFTEAGTPGKIGEITPAGTITEVAVPTATGGPDTITVGPDHNLWFTEHGARGQIGELALGIAAAGGSGSDSGSSGSDSGSTGVTAGGTGPAATTQAATHVTPAAARLNGTSADAIVGDTYHFDWGTTTAYGQSTRETTITHGTITSGRDLFAELGGLGSDTTYHFRLVVSNCGGCATGTTEGADSTFTTATAPAAIAQRAVAGVVAGTIQVRRPGSRHLVTLTGSQDVPVGSLVDASHGHLRLTTALPGRRTQSATLWGGAFVVTQNAHTGMTTFTLAPLSCPAVTAAIERPALVSPSAIRRSPRRRVSLWARDNHGLYTTRGNNSVATVRGTTWETIATCAGTRTVVARGVVAVRDLHRHRTVLVRAGHSYLARR